MLVYGRQASKVLFNLNIFRKQEYFKIEITTTTFFHSNSQKPIFFQSARAGITLNEHKHQAPRQKVMTGRNRQTQTFNRPPGGGPVDLLSIKNSASYKQHSYSLGNDCIQSMINCYRTRFRKNVGISKSSVFKERGWKSAF